MGRGEDESQLGGKRVGITNPQPNVALIHCIEYTYDVRVWV